MEIEDSKQKRIRNISYKKVYSAPIEPINGGGTTRP